MWSTEVAGECRATPAEVFAVLSDPMKWSEWNEGVADIRIDGPFAAGTTAVMTLPDGMELPFALAWVEEGRGFEDVTVVPHAGVTVRVRHDLQPIPTGTRIIYRCTAEGPDPVAGEIGAGVTADFSEVIAALGARAEQLHRHA